MRLFRDEPESSDDVLGAPEIGKGAVEVIDHALDLGASDPRTATLRVAVGFRQRPLECRQCPGHVPEFVEDIAEETAQGEAVLSVPRQLETAGDQLAPGVEAVRPPLALRGLEIRSHRGRIACTVQMRGPERRITLREPLRGAPVQLAAMDMEGAK